MTELTRLDTWFIQEGDEHHVRLPAFSMGDDGNQQVLVCDDRGDLLAPVFVEEAEHDGLLLLKQFGASHALIETISAAQEYGDIDPSQVVWAIRRTPTGYEVEEDAVRDLEDMM